MVASVTKNEMLNLNFVDPLALVAFQNKLSNVLKKLKLHVPPEFNAF